MQQQVDVEAAAAGSKGTFQEQHSWVSGRNQSEEAVLHLAAPPGFVFGTACVFLFLDRVISGRVPPAALAQGDRKLVAVKLEKICG